MRSTVNKRSVKAFRSSLHGSSLKNTHLKNYCNNRQCFGYKTIYYHFNKRYYHLYSTQRTKSYMKTCPLLPCATISRNSNNQFFLWHPFLHPILCRPLDIHSCKVKFVTFTFKEWGIIARKRQIRPEDVVIITHH